MTIGGKEIELIIWFLRNWILECSSGRNSNFGLYGKGASKIEYYVNQVGRIFFS